MNVAIGATSVPYTFRVENDVGAGVTGLLAATMPALFYRVNPAGARVAITLVDIAIGAAWTSSGVAEIGSGDYRLDPPNAGFVSGGTWILSGDGTGKHVRAYPIGVGLPLIDATLIATAAAQTTAQTAINLVKAQTDRIQWSDNDFVQADVRAWLDNGVAATTAGVPNVHVVSIVAGGITTASFTAGAINATAIATDAFGALELAADAVTEIANAVGSASAAAIADAVWDELLSGHVIVGSGGALLSAAGSGAGVSISVEGTSIVGIDE